MQHDVDEAVLQAFSEARMGPPAEFSFGLSVARLQLASDRESWGPALAGVGALDLAPAVDDTETLVWDELVPAHPRRVRARNPSASSIVVEPGSVLAGGMSTRAVARTTVVPPGVEVIVAVEVVGARWWDEGELLPSAPLMPIAAALMLQAGFGDTPSASSARTALWSFGRADATALASVASPGGWVILEQDRVFAGWLAERGVGEIGWLEAATLSDDAVDLGVGVVASLRRGLQSRVLVSHALDDEQSGREWIVVPRTFHLVDAVTGATSEHAA